MTPEPAFVTAETAWRMMTQRDPHVNILRTTVAVFAAALGGADAIAVLPFTAALGLPDALARRIARNTQLVLLQEAHLAKVADPAAGSGAVEDLTDQLCRAAWCLFQEIEAAGGAAAALESGLIQGKVAAVRAQRAAAVARRKEALTGVSIFPDLHEAEVAVVLPPPLAGEGDHAQHGGGGARQRGDPGVPTPPPPPFGRSPSPAPLRSAGEDREGAGEDISAPLPPIRLAQPFEALRDASDRCLAATGARPRIFLANLGTPADFTARATFAKNFFAAGGIEAVGSEDAAIDPNTQAQPNLDALVSAFRQSGAALACLCASDKVYESESATTAAAALKAAGARHIYLAGRPGAAGAAGAEGAAGAAGAAGARETALRRAGVQSFIYEDCDALATLRAAYDILGIRQQATG